MRPLRGREISVKAPDECASLQDVRAAIDEIDHAIVALIARRRGYVEAAAAFKTSATGVSDPDRVAAMMAQRRRWATEAGLSPAPIEHLFQMLVSYFTSVELQHWQEQQESRPRHGLWP